MKHVITFVTLTLQFFTIAKAHFPVGLFKDSSLSQHSRSQCGSPSIALTLNGFNDHILQISRTVFQSNSTTTKTLRIYTPFCRRLSNPFTLKPPKINRKEIKKIELHELLIWTLSTYFQTLMNFTKDLCQVKKGCR